MIGIIGAMKPEVEELISLLQDRTEETVSGIRMHRGRLEGRDVVIAGCGVGKVFAAICAEAMILRYAPELIVNTGVAGTLTPRLSVGDVAIASQLVQHDMDTTSLGDPPGLISGTDRVYFKTDARARDILVSAAAGRGLRALIGTVASGDVFVSSEEQKGRIVSLFSAVACEMEGAAIAQTCYVNATPCTVIRAISDSADGSSHMDYAAFLPLAAKNSARLVRALVQEYGAD